jgi:hypothetical protein
MSPEFGLLPQHVPRGRLRRYNISLNRRYAIRGEKFRIGLVENGRDLPMQQISCSKSVTFQESVSPKIRRPPGNRAAFSFQGRIVPTEAKDPVKTFWSKSYEPKKQGVKQFLTNKHLLFQQLT